MTDKLSSKQIGILAFVMLLCSKLTVLPSLFYQTNKSGGILCISFVMLIEAVGVILFLFMKKKYPDVSYYELVVKKLGLFIAKIFYFLFFVYFSFQLLFVLIGAYTYLREIVYEEATFIVFIMAILPVINSLTFNGPKALARTCEFYFIFIVLGLVLCVFLGISSIQQFQVAIFNNFQLSTFFSGIFDHSMWFGDLFFLIFFMDKISVKNGYGNKILGYSIFAMIIIILYTLAFYLLYTTTSSIHTNSLSDIIQYSTNVGDVGKIEIIPILTFMFLIYLQSGILFYTCSQAFKKCFNFNNKIMTIIILDALIITLRYLVFYSRNVTVNFALTYGKYFSFTMQVAVFLFAIYTLVTPKLKKSNKVLYSKRIVESK